MIEKPVARKEKFMDLLEAKWCFESMGRRVP
jgi:hypothetical protein